MLDLFQITQPQLMRLEPVWICSTFIGNGIDKTKKDLERHNIAIFYPYADEFEGHERFWKNYLFIKKISNLGFLFELVHKNSKFLYFISDENGPIPVRNSEINKVKADITRGFYAQK